MVAAAGRRRGPIRRLRRCGHGQLRARPQQLQIQQSQCLAGAGIHGDGAAAPSRWRCGGGHGGPRPGAGRRRRCPGQDGATRGAKDWHETTPAGAAAARSSRSVMGRRRPDSFQLPVASSKAAGNFLTIDWKLTGYNPRWPTRSSNSPRQLSLDSRSSDRADLRRHPVRTTAFDRRPGAGRRQHAAHAEHRVQRPLLSAAMDTVTESRWPSRWRSTAGSGVIHKNLSIEEQASEVDRVKRSESGMIVNPITLSPTRRIREALDLMSKYRISGVPITEDGSKEGRLVGILTNRDLRFETNVDRPVSDVMTKSNLITVPVGTTLDEAARNPASEESRKAPGRRSRLPVEGPHHGQGHPESHQVSQRVQGFARAPARRRRRRHRARHARARTRAGRGPRRVLVVDTAHGHSQGVLDMVQGLRRAFKESRSSRVTSRPRKQPRH